MTLVNVTGHADDGTPGIRPPVRCKQTGEGRDEINAAVVLHGPGEALDIGGLLDQPEVIAQPLDQCPGDGDRTFQGIHSRLVPDLVAKGGQ